MTVIHMSEKGQVVVPKEIRDQHGYRNGSAFAVLETAKGDIVLRPVQTDPKMDLVDHLLRFKGLGIEIPGMHFHLLPHGYGQEVTSGCDSQPARNGKA